MNALASIALVALTFTATAPAAAQDLTAEVRTWDGVVWRLARPAFEALYTIAPMPKEGAALPDAEKRQVSSGSRGGIFASLDALKGLVDKKPDVPIDASRPTDTLTLSRGGVETRVPVDRIASLAFFRQPLVNSPLPPHVFAEHVRYAATAVLRDGTRIEADYVHLGAVRLRGETPQGRVDIPWDRIEVVRFAP